jgi:tetratricopeptide (TPR) repeat protein
MPMIRYAFACSLLVISLGAGGALAHDAEPPSTQTNPASQINPTAKTYFDQGKAHEKKKSWDLAIAAYQQAVRLEPKFAEAWNNMGYCHRKLKQYDKALEAYKQAITLKPDLSYPHEYMSRTYLAMGNKDSAMREYEILKRLDAKMAEQLLKAIQANDPDLGDND